VQQIIAFSGYIIHAVPGIYQPLSSGLGEVLDTWRLSAIIPTSKEGRQAVEKATNESLAMQAH
jgi:hypothetical protein